MTTRKTITVSDQQDEWIKARIGTGAYTNDSEYIRDLIRRDQERYAKIEAMQKLIDEGIASGISARSMDEIRADARARLNSGNA
ncbi:MAG TPA: type II toxin-antitoxin system ParD family antitoxin [Novosphingobium sp.]|nr:type II toxin-antitoxin system ParD family antitoxin [Novosphingobium sp.]